MNVIHKFSEFLPPFYGNKEKTKLARSQNMCTTLIQTLLRKIEQICKVWQKVVGVTLISYYTVTLLVLHSPSQLVRWFGFYSDTLQNTKCNMKCQPLPSQILTVLLSSISLSL